MQNARTFLRQERLKPNRTLRLEDIVTSPEQDDAAFDDFASETGYGQQPPQQGLGQQQPDEQAQPTEPLPLMSAQAVGFNEAASPTKTEQPSNRRRALAQSLLEQGSQPFNTGAGWWGVADRVAATGVGSWMDSRETDREEATKKTALNDFLSSLDDTDPVHRFAKTIAMQGDVPKATDLILRHETQKQIAAMKKGGAPTSRNRTDGLQTVTEEWDDEAKAWKRVSSGPRKLPGEGGGDGGHLDPGVAKVLAARLLSGDSRGAMVGISRSNGTHMSDIMTAALNLGRGQINPKTNKPFTEEEIGRLITQATIEFEGQKAGVRSVQQRGALLRLASHAVLKQVGILTAASNAVPRGHFVPWNSLVNMVRTNTGDPRTARFDAAITAFVNAYSRAISPSGAPAQSEKEHAYEKLRTAFSKGQFNATVQLMQQEMEQELAAVHETISELGDEFNSTRFGAQAEAKINGLAGDLGIDPSDVSQGSAANAAQPQDPSYDYRKAKDGTPVRRKKGSKGDWETY